MFFQWPLLLFSLGMVPIVVVLYILAQRRRKLYTVRFTNLELLQSVAGKGPGIRRHIPPLLFLLALVAFLMSLARPVAVITVPRDQATVILVIDTSGSMEARDIQPNRMEAAKRAARAFVDSLPSNIQVGLVTFNSTPSLRAPITQDRTVTLKAIDLLKADGNTAIGEGLNMALEQLQDLPKQNGQEPLTATIVLLSDGANMTGMSPAIVAARAKEVNITVNTVGIGDRSSSGIRRGMSLDEPALQQVASITGGKYFYAAEANTLRQVYTDLSSRISWVEEQTEITTLVSAIGILFFLVSGFLALRWFQRFP